MATFGIVFTLVVACIVIYDAEGYCAIKNRETHANISKAIIQGSRFLIEAQDTDGKWIDVHTTGNVIATLKLIGYSNDETKSCAKTFAKAAQFLNASRGVLNNTHGEKLAHVIMGLNALCEDPKDFMGMDLTDRLLTDMNEFPKGSFKDYFQYALSMVALGVNDKIVPWAIPKRLIDKVDHILSTGEAHTKDSCAMFVIGLSAVYQQFNGSTSEQGDIGRIITRLVTSLGMKTKINRDNLNTKSLVMQAYTAANKMLGWDLNKCEHLYSALLSNKGADGSFGSISANLHVLPALVGVSYLDLKKSLCPATKTDKEPKKKISVCVKVEFEDNPAANPPQQNVIISEGSTALAALKAASSMLQRHHEANSMGNVGAEHLPDEGEPHK